MMTAKFGFIMQAVKLIIKHIAKTCVLLFVFSIFLKNVAVILS